VKIDTDEKDRQWELGELVALSQIGEKGRGREEVVVMMRGRDAHGREERQWPWTQHKGGCTTQ